MEIGKKKKEILSILADPSNTAISQTRLSEILGIKQASVSQHLSELEAQGLIEIDKSRSKNDIKELTREGFIQEKKAVGVEKPISGDEALDVNLHNLVVKFKIKNKNDLDSDWIERAMVSRPVRYVYDPTNSSYQVYSDKFEFRVTSRHIFVKVGELQGEDPNNLKNRGMVEAFKARDWLQDNSPLDLESRPQDMEISVNRQHLSIIGHPFAQLVDQYSELELSDVKVYDSEGTERLWLDSSNGPELEAGNAPGENLEYSEEDISLLIDELKWKIENKDEAEKLRNIEAYEKRLEALENRLDELEVSQSATVTDELNISSKWRDRWGNVMGYSQDLKAPIKLYDKSEV